MPLAGTEKALASEIAGAIKSAQNETEGWEMVITKILQHITKNALVTGVCPSNGGPLTGGKIT
ncbi:hypothetical protein [Pseudobacteriovorax antillogorgiicola]|uniref:Uncharacterized protein n=1 Tax=Pseudobacteriovorax antillogorgiicola TaxID=1513793 RepID=A0A1Y6CNZ3_9BACT|nr:hypothetical protein [Pseudobacteriovorax antillogorgiicola]TCS44262.1 hypothetical protein EDD56_13462 [Pseudobacteriovorax antillogorgiicola]SMF80815.1 hypothetical protein SAMN06296036_13563 [Pseudobacteriovorax antillogorgiicola]